MNQIIAELRDFTGKEIEPVYEDPRPGDVVHSLADISRARDALGYEPRVGAREGLRLAFAHYEERRRAGAEAIAG